MSSLADRLDNLHVRVKAPGVEIYAELRNRDNVTISFEPGIYDWLDERHLEHHMSGLARLLYVAWVRAYRAALPEGFQASLGEVDTQADRDYLAAREDLVTEGASPDRRIVLVARGMHEIRVHIAPGTIRALDEYQFAEHTRQAFAALLHERLTQIRELKQRFYE
jgi:hypothetical protein